MRIYEAIGRALETEGVDTLFGLMGDGNMLFWSALAQAGTVAIHPVWHEAAAIGMADGYFRETGRTGVASVTAGPGLTQIATSLMAAARNRTPLVVITGEIPPSEPNRIQSFDQRRFIEACETRYIPVSGPDRLALETMQAFLLARRDRCPVVLAIDNALQSHEIPDTWRYLPSADMLRPDSCEPTGTDLAYLACALRRAERLVLVAGRGARAAGMRAGIAELGAMTGALLGTSLQAKGLFSDETWSVGILGGFASAACEDLCREADLVVGFGAELGYYTSWGGALFPQAEVIRIDNAASSGEVGVAPGYHIRADLDRVVSETLARLRASGHSATGYRTPATEAVMSAPRATPIAATDGIDPRAAARALGPLLPEIGRITCGNGHFASFVSSYMPISPNAHFELSGQFAAIGQALFLAMGRAVAEPEKPHVLIEGDGGLLMCMQSLETVVRLGLDLTIICWNDCGYGAEAQRLPAKELPPDSATWESPDFVSIVRGYGGKARRVDRLGDLAPAMAELRGPGLSLVDLRVSPSEMSDRYRKLDGTPSMTPHLR